MPEKISYHAVTSECDEHLLLPGKDFLKMEQVEGAVMLIRFGSPPGYRYAKVFGIEVARLEQEIVERSGDIHQFPQKGAKLSIYDSVSAGSVWRHGYSGSQNE